MRVDVNFFAKVGIVALSIMLIIFTAITFNKDMQIEYIMKINGELVFKEELELYTNLIRNEMERTENVTTDELSKIVHEKALDSLIKAKVVTEKGKKLKLLFTVDEENQKVIQLKELWEDRKIAPVTDEALDMFAKDLIINDKVYEHVLKDVLPEEHENFFNQKIDEWIKEANIEYVEGNTYVLNDGI